MGVVAYKVDLSHGALMHATIHVSQLKLACGMDQRNHTATKGVCEINDSGSEARYRKEDCQTNLGIRFIIYSS